MLETIGIVFLTACYTFIGSWYFIDFFLDDIYGAKPQPLWKITLSAVFWPAVMAYELVQVVKGRLTHGK